jgi:hypothetical protein
MACDLQRIANLPVPEKYKMALLEFFQKPENAGACEELMQASDEEIMSMMSNMEQSIGGGQAAPGPGPQQPQAGPQNPAAGGIGSMPPSGQPPSPPGVPPGQLAQTPDPMSVPAGGISQLNKPGGY